MTTNGQQIVFGALVQWTEADAYGVVTQAGDEMIHVQWDDGGCPPQFRAANAPLLRVDLRSQLVSVKSTGATAIATHPVESSPPAWQCRVVEAGGVRNINIAEADLRPVPVNDPVQRFQQNKIGSLNKYRLHEATRWYRGLHLYDELVSPWADWSGH